MQRVLALSVVALAGLLGLAAPCAAAEPAADFDVDLELILAVDVSRSMDYAEQKVQRDGYVAAFRHSEVIDAIRQGALGRIAVTYFEWAGASDHWMIIPWMMIANEADAEVFAQKLEAAPQTREMGTSISSSLYFAAGQFGQAFQGYRQAVDVSGDGPNNMGRPVAPARDWLVARGVTINGLPIMLRRSFSSGPYGIPNLDVYYEDCVIGGPGAFMVTVTEPSEFASAIRRKLVLEIAGLPPRIIAAAEVTKPPRIDCLIGEKSRRGWYFDPAER